MPVNFKQVPDGTSWENQGANVAAADLDGDGSPELIVLRVDHPTPGPNRGFYRVGRRLQQSKYANAIRPTPVLNRGGDFAFDPDGIRDDEHQYGEDANDLQRAKERELRRVRQVVEPIHGLNPKAEFRGPKEERRSRSE